MAVVDVTLMWSRDGGTVSTDPKDFTYRKIVRTRGYQVLTDDPETPQNEVEFADELPEIGDIYNASNEYVKLISKRVSKLGPVFWLVECDYEGDNEFLLNRPIIKKSSVTTSEPIDRDWNGRAIVNTNKEPVEGLTRDVSDTLITITRNYETIDDDLVLQYLESTNSDTWYGYAAGRVRMINYQAEQMFRNEKDITGYWKVTAAFQVRRGYNNTTAAQAWYVRVRNEGLYEKSDIGGGARIIRASDESGSPSTKPVLLKQTGYRETNPDDAYFFHVQVYGSLPYNALGLLS